MRSILILSSVAAISLFFLEPVLCAPPTVNHSTVVMRRLRDASFGVPRLTNGGFEANTAWTPYQQGFERVQEGVHGGQYAIRCQNATAHDHRGAQQTVDLNQTHPVPILATGWSRCQDVSGAPAGDYSLYLDLLYQDGTPLWGQVAPFNSGTHGWERQEVMILPEKPVKSVTLYALFRNRAGTAWFDDFTLAEMTSARGQAFFDGVPVQLPQPPTSHRAVSLGGKSFQLLVDPTDGQPQTMRYGSASLNLNSGAPGGFFIRDAAADSDFYSVGASPIHAAGRGWRQDGVIPALQLGFHASYLANDDSTEVQGEVSDTSGRPRAITVYYALPVPRDGLRWWDTLRDSRPVEQGGVYANTHRIGVGNTGEISRWPFSCLQTPAMGASLDLPLDSPRVARVAYNAASGQYYVAFDLGIVPGPSASFRFTITASDPAWGMRAAASRYYDRYGSFFTNRVKRQGIWMPFSSISKIDHPEDFGFAFKEGNNETAWDAAHNVYTFRYTEPMSWWMTIPTGVARNYDVAIDYMNRYATGQLGGPDQRKYALATQVAGTFTSDGKYIVSIVDAPWSHGALFIDNPNPYIADSPDKPNRAHVAWTPEIERSLYDDKTRPIQDGEYLDSMEGWAETHNFRADHFPYEHESLTFDTASKKPCILEGVSSFEFARWLANEVHQKDKLMFANGTPWNYFWYASVLDVMGTETGWLGEDNRYRPDDDAIMLYRRALSYHRPYLLLMNVDFDRFTHPMVEQYMQRSLFYGIYPSMFSHNAADQPYWTNPAWYNRDRDLFRRYIPLVREVAETGWEPITGARSSDPQVWVERFGGQGKAPPAFTVFNNAATTRNVTLTFTPADFHAPLPPAFADHLNGRIYPVQTAGVHPTLNLSLAPQQVISLWPAK